MNGVKAMSQHDEMNIQIIATSDMHSHILNESERSNIYRAGTYINEVRRQYDHVVLLDNGGNLAGSITAFYYAVIAPYKRHPMIKLMNAMAYDASGISSNEFKYGLDFLNRSIALARFSWLSANIEYSRTREPYFSTPYMVKNINGLKIAVVGLTSEGLMKNENIEMESDVTVEKATVAAKRWIRYIYETVEPEFLIVLYHGGLSKLSHDSKSQGENQAEMIMKQVGIIDLMITGHQHETVIENDGETLFVQAGQNAENLVHVNVKFRKRRNSFELLEMEPEIVSLNEYEEDQSLLDLTHYDRKAVRSWKNESIHHHDIDMCFSHLHELLVQPHPYIQLLHESLVQELEANMTCVNLPLPNATGLKGVLKNEDIYNMYPHPDKPMDMTLKVSVIKQLIEESVAHLEWDGNYLTVGDMDPTHFLFWSGFDFTIDINQQPYHRVTQFGLREDYSYRIVMTDYIYRHYKEILQDVTLHQTYPVTMPELIAKILKQQLEIKRPKSNMSITGL